MHISYILGTLLTPRRRTVLSGWWACRGSQHFQWTGYGQEFWASQCSVHYRMYAVVRHAYRGRKHPNPYPGKVLVLVSGWSIDWVSCIQHLLLVRMTLRSTLQKKCRYLFFWGKVLSWVHVCKNRSQTNTLFWFDDYSVGIWARYTYVHIYVYI